MGKWSHADQIPVCALRLTETTRVYYSATPALRAPNITWSEFKASLLKRFRDVKVEQYHDTKLQLARQRRNEKPAEILDRVVMMVGRTIPCEKGPVMQRANEVIAEGKGCYN
jgi:hypothetical protein